MNAKLKEKYFLVIVIITFINMFVAGGLANNLTLYTLPVSETLGITRSSFSLCVAIRGIMQVISSLASGYLYSKLGSRILIPASLAIGAIGYFIFSQSYTVGLLCLGYAILGIGDGICIINASVYVIGRWFRKNYGLFLGIVSAATGIGGGVFSVILSAIIDASGWRTAFFVSAIFYIALGLIIALFMRDRPEKMGLEPYGDGSKTAKKEKKVFEGYTEKQLFKKTTFYIYILLVFLSGLLAYMISSIIVPFFQDKGFSITEAATVNSAFLISLAVAKIALGFINDKLGAKVVALLSVFSGTVTTFFLTRVAGLFEGYLIMIPSGMFLTMAAVVPSFVCTDLFGHRAGPKPALLATSAISAAHLFGAVISNSVYDKVGSYLPVLYAVCIATVVISIFWTILFITTTKEKRKFLKQQENK